MTGSPANSSASWRPSGVIAISPIARKRPSGKRVSVSLTPGTNVAVLTVPQSVAQPLADRLIALGVKGFWNFTNVELSTQTKGVFFEDIHFVDTLLTLSYRISRPEELY